MTDHAAPPAGPLGGITDAPAQPVPPVALVTGAARGVGAATVAALAAGGWRVIAADRCADDPALPYPLGTRADLDRVAEAAGGDVVPWVADARDPGALAAAVGEAERRWGGLDAAIAVAGVIAGGVPAWEFPADQEAALLDINLGGVLNLARAAVPALLRRPVPRRGRFIAVASAAESFASQQPLGRLLAPEEVAAVIAFLAGEGASGMTGAIVPVDGGLAL